MRLFKPVNPAPPSAAGRCRMRSHDINQRGYTLTEAALVLVLMAIITSLALPRYRGYLADRSLQNAAHLIQGDLRLAQQEAVARAGSGSRVEMCFRSNGFNLYAVDYQDSIGRTGAQIGEAIKVANAGAEYASGITVTVDATASDPCLVDASRQAIVFSSGGTPISFDDSSSKDISLALNGRTYRVTIAPSSGRATVGR